MKRWKLLLLVVVAGLGLFAFKPGPSTSLSDFRVVTFNVRNSDMNDPGQRAWSQRRAVASAMLLRLDADILGLQEVSPAQRADLDLDLNGYRSLGQGREGRGKGEQCPIYSRRSLPTEAEGMFWLSPTPLKPSVGWDARMPRICTWIRYPGVTVFNTHLDYAGPASRREALKLIRRQARGSAVIMGDFNDREGSQTLDPVDDLVDAFRAVHPRVAVAPDGTRLAQNVTTYTAFRKENQQGARLDFVLVTPDLRPVEAEIITAKGDVLPSDHRALAVRLRRGSPPAP
ncbi:MAG: endonuclease/exonuclease/phosphatase family protein [Candidatus Eremiobacteraeota bacterium]|nr:endonuclease/exonuclease/phosphatase family protein [Candidatus Eremiobacteraeota bacterium]MCW5869844.1 endonuclease/exonuclease/phosphatase family protein [Candidatus Eremiobacteraeota bacterium]